MDLVHEAVALLNGTHDFMSFTLPSRMDEIPPTLRNVDISLEPGTSLLSPFTAPLLMSLTTGTLSTSRDLFSSGRQAPTFLLCYHILFIMLLLFFFH